MEEEAVNLVDVDVHCSTIHAILDMLVARIDGSVAVANPDIEQLEVGKGPAGAWHKQGRDERIQALAAPQVGCGRLAEDVVKRPVVQIVEKHSSAYWLDQLKDNYNQSSRQL